MQLDPAPASRRVLRSEGVGEATIAWVGAAICTNLRRANLEIREG